MTTPDGISTEDWDHVHELAVEIVNADVQESRECKTRLLSYLDKLQEKYGKLPSILATRADYVDDVEVGRDLLHRAYKLAEARGDAHNQFYAAHSLAKLYIEEFKNGTEGRKWFDRTRQHMIQVDDADYADDLRAFRDALEQLPPRPP